MAWGEFRELRLRFWKRRMEETLRPAQRHRYVGKGGDSQERRRKEAGGRGDSTHGDRLIQGVEN